MTTTKPEIIFKPKYNWSMRVAMILYPVWVALSVYFLYQWILTHSFSPLGFLVVVFGIMTFSLPFREVRFGDRIVVKCYFLSDQVIEYKDVASFDKMRLNTATSGISLYMLNHGSLDEFDKIIHNLMSARRIKLKKK